MKNVSEESSAPGKCRALIVGERYRKTTGAALEDLGFHVIYMPDNPNVDTRVAGHADLSVLRTGEREIFLAPHLKGTEFEASVRDIGYDIIFPEITQGKEYPLDADFNIVFLGNNMLCGRKNRLAERLSSSHGFKRIAISQGYARCSTCIVSENALITADSGIENAARTLGYDVLKIHPGFFRLPGFDYGFIGGSSFLLDGKLYFTGSISSHADKNVILSFLTHHNTAPVFLSSERAEDIGTVIVL